MILKYFSTLYSMIDDYQLVDSPILVTVVRKIATNDDGNLALLQLLHRYLQRIRFALQFDHYRSAHRYLKCPGAQDSCSLVFSHVSRRDSLGFLYTSGNFAWCQKFDILDILLLCVQLDIVIIVRVVEFVGDLISVEIVVSHCIEDAEIVVVWQKLLFKFSQSSIIRAQNLFLLLDKPPRTLKLFEAHFFEN